MKKKHYTKAQMLSIYADWQQSRISKKAYCQQIGLTTSTASAVRLFLLD